MTSLELSAVNCDVEKCKPYLLGLPYFEIVTDHQALVSMLNTKTLDEIENPRQKNMKEQSRHMPGQRLVRAASSTKLFVR